MKMIIVVISGERTWEDGRGRSGAGGWGKGRVEKGSELFVLYPQALSRGLREFHV